MYVSVSLTSGLGNRCFQVYAMLGYAERMGFTPLFVREWIEPCPHPGPISITDLFPEIAVVPTAASTGGPWVVHTMAGEDAFTYVPLPAYASHVKLVGFFQSEQYFPSVVRTPSCLRSFCEQAFPNRAFLHVRRGDYLLPVCQHHCVDLRDYYRKAVALFESDTEFLVCSDDLAWCRAELPRLLPEVADHRWIWADPAGSDVATWAAMVQCLAGGICANSTFSWLPGYWISSPSKRYVLPSVWGKPPLPPARDLIPASALVVHP